MAGTDQRTRMMRIEYPFDHHFDLAAGNFVPGQSCFDYACVIKHNHIAGLQKIRQVTEMTISISWCLTLIDIQHTAIDPVC